MILCSVWGAFRLPSNLFLLDDWLVSVSVHHSNNTFRNYILFRECTWQKSNECGNNSVCMDFSVWVIVLHGKNTWSESICWSPTFSINFYRSNLLHFLFTLLKCNSLHLLCSILTHLPFGKKKKNWLAHCRASTVYRNHLNATYKWHFMHCCSSLDSSNNDLRPSYYFIHLSSNSLPSCPDM